MLRRDFPNFNLVDFSVLKSIFRDFQSKEGLPKKKEGLPKIEEGLDKYREVINECSKVFALFKGKINSFEHFILFLPQKKEGLPKICQGLLKQTNKQTNLTNKQINTYIGGLYVRKVTSTQSLLNMKF